MKSEIYSGNDQGYPAFPHFAAPKDNKEEGVMIVIYRNGVPTVITGWRAWLIMLGAAVAFVVVMGVVLGLALTVWTIMLFALPVMILFGLIATWLQRMTSSGHRD